MKAAHSQDRRRGLGGRAAAPVRPAPQVPVGVEPRLLQRAALEPLVLLVPPGDEVRRPVRTVVDLPKAATVRPRLEAGVAVGAVRPTLKCPIGLSADLSPAATAGAPPW